MAKPSSDTVGQSFCTYLETSSMHSNDNSGESKGDENDLEIEKTLDKEKVENNASDEETIHMLDSSAAPLSTEQHNIFEEKQKESVSLTPKLIKSLMHRRVIKIASGGVHNICIVEPYPNHIVSDIYKQFKKSKFTDVCFVLREKNYGLKETAFEEDKESISDDEVSITTKPKNRLRKAYFEYKINAHKFILASRSSVFKSMFKKNNTPKAIVLDKKVDVTSNLESGVEVIQIKDCSFKAFRLIIDYIYLDNLNILDDV